MCVLQIMSLDASGRHVAGSHLANPSRLGEQAAGVDMQSKRASFFHFYSSVLSAEQGALCCACQSLHYSLADVTQHVQITFPKSHA
jgi:hypothetical protein